MSEQHKQKMVDAVAIACNKTYRLWVKRHPEFEEKGRVHIIAHSVRLLAKCNPPSARADAEPTSVARICARQ